MTLVEGAGGLLSPIGEGFASRELILSLQARTIIVMVDRLGVLNEALLTWEAMPPRARSQAQWVLFAPAIPDASTGGNRAFLAEKLGGFRLHALPRLSAPEIRRPGGSLASQLDSMLACLGIPAELPARDATAKDAGAGC